MVERPLFLDLDLEQQHWIYAQATGPCSQQSGSFRHCCFVCLADSGRAAVLLFEQQALSIVQRAASLMGYAKQHLDQEITK